MCGIVAYLGNREARQFLVDCLGRLEDRAYDSAGIGTLAAGKLRTLRSLGNKLGTQSNLSNLKAALKRSPLSGKIGVAHAYRSARNQPYNAHSQSDGNFIAIVHDGSSVNERVVASLLEHDDAGLEAVLPQTLQLLQGEFTLVGISQQEPDRIVAARRGRQPLVIGHHYDGYFVASDMAAISHYTRDYQQLEDGEIAVVSYAGVRITTFDGTPVQRPLRQHAGDAQLPHEAPAFMARSAVG